MKGMNRSTCINFLKVFATYLVFSQHSTIVCNEELGFELSSLPMQLFNTPSQGGVWMFLAIGGFLASWGFDRGKYSLDVQGSLKYYRNRVIKILVPTWIFISLAFFIDDNAHLNGWQFTKLLTCLYNGTGVGIVGIGASWYIFIVMWLYLLTPVVLKWMKKIEHRFDGREVFFYLTIIAVLFVYGIAYRIGCEHFGLSKYNWRYANILACGDCFFIGVVSSQLIRFLKAEKTRVWAGKSHIRTLCIALLTIVILMSTFKNLSIYLKGFHALISPSLYAVLSAAIIVLTPEDCEKTGNSKFAAVVNTLVKFTFLFYLWHSLVMIHICHRLPLDSSFESFLLVYGIGFVVTAYLAFLMTQMNENIIKVLSKER